MNKFKLAVAAVAGFLFFACVGKTDVDFSIVPVQGSNGEYQYIDIAKKGKITINPQFGQAHIFRDGLALVKTSGRDGKWGYIDKKGKYVIAPTYNYAQDFGDGVAWVQLEDQPPMLIDKKGKTLLQMDSLTSAVPFSNGMAGINFYSQGQESGMFIDKKGEPAVTTAGEKVFLFIKDGLYAFEGKDTEKWGYKNKNGEIAINAQFDDIEPFIDGMAVAKNGKKWGAIDKKGNFIINPQYDFLRYDGKGLFLAQVGKKWGWVNKKGEIAINPQFDLNDPGLNYLMGFNGGKLSAVQMGSKWGYIDKGGQIVVNPQFQVALPFSGDYAMVVDNGDKIGFIDKKGSFVVSPLYDLYNANIAASIFSEYVMAIRQNLYGLPANYLYGTHSSNFLSYQRLREKVQEERERELKKKEEESKGARTAEAEARAEAPPEKATSGIFADSRDGKTYKTVNIGTQTWMAENLNYDAKGSVCYDNKPANCEKYGRLYDWNIAMKSCPSGWHLPTNTEWDKLYRHADGTSETDSPYESKTAGKYLKAVSGWSNGGNGTDDYDFAALPGGNYYNGSFTGADDYGYWWSASEGSGKVAHRRSILYSDDHAYWRSGSKSYLLSVRCVKD